MNRYSWTLSPTSRVRFTGKLRMTSALHVGSGSESSLSNAGVIKHLDGRPFIPGSSMKGILRSHLERLAQVLPGVESCLLYKTNRPTACPTPNWIEKKEDATKASIKDFEKLCHTCTLFGSPILAGKVRVPDLEVDELTYAGQTEVRDGVGIDRDNGLAVDGVKYDFEVVPSDTVFYFQLDVDSPDKKERALIAAGIREMQQGYVSVGGKTTRGLGACRLEDIQVYETDFSNPEQFKTYLKSKEPAAKADVERFLSDTVETLFDASSPEN